MTAILKYGRFFEVIFTESLAQSLLLCDFAPFFQNVRLYIYLNVYLHFNFIFSAIF